MCVCAYVDVCEYLCVCRCAYVYMCVISVCMLYVCGDACVYVRACIHACVCVCVCMHVCVCVRVVHISHHAVSEVRRALWELVLLLLLGSLRIKLSCQVWLKHLYPPSHLAAPK